MAVIPGATVTYTDFTAPTTPRILEIPDAAGDITAQDIWDTLSEDAAKLENLVYKKLINRANSGGKNELKASPLKLVDITMQMNNVIIHFEDLPGPTYTTKEIDGGNILAVDHLAAVLDPMKNSTFVNWKLTSDTAGVLLAGTGGNQTDSDNIQKSLDILEGDHFENSQKVQIFKKGTATKVLDKDIGGSLLTPGVNITTNEP